MKSSQITFHIRIAAFLAAADVGSRTSLVRRHAQCVGKRITRGVQGVRTGLAMGFFHERRMPC